MYLMSVLATRVRAVMAPSCLDKIALNVFTNSAGSAPVFSSILSCSKPPGKRQQCRGKFCRQVTAGWLQPLGCHRCDTDKQRVSV